MNVEEAIETRINILFNEQIYVLEYSEHSYRNGSYPFNIGEIKKTLKKNYKDMLHNQQGYNKWQIVFIGSFDECNHILNSLLEKHPKWLKKIKDFQ